MQNCLILIKNSSHKLIPPNATYLGVYFAHNCSIPVTFCVEFGSQSLLLSHVTILSPKQYVQKYVYLCGFCTLSDKYCLSLLPTYLSY